MIIRTLTTVSVLLLASNMTLTTLQGATITPPAPIHLATVNTKAEVEMLRAAYGTLAKADHDYKGHRVLAMHAIEKACDALGTDIRGDGKDHVPQPISDEDLREARRKVAEVRDAAKLSYQKEVAEHLTNAVAELDIALTIK